jgi:hypothetical protein
MPWRGNPDDCNVRGVGTNVLRWRRMVRHYHSHDELDGILITIWYTLSHPNAPDISSTSKRRPFVAPTISRDPAGLKRTAHGGGILLGPVQKA